ncbi:hypothetical protein ACVILK_006815 [Bradyrhizobium embrapense]
MAHPRSVRIGGLRSLVVSIEMAPDTTNRCVRHSFPSYHNGILNGGAQTAEFHDRPRRTVLSQWGAG